MMMMMLRGVVATKRTTSKTMWTKRQTAADYDVAVVA